MQLMWDSQASWEVVAAQIDGQMRQGHEDAPATEGCGTVAEISGSGGQIVLEVGGGSGGLVVTVQISGASPGPNRWNVAGSTAEHQVGVKVLGAIGQDAAKRRGRDQGVINFL